jgi:hypothetical protein
MVTVIQAAISHFIVSNIFTNQNRVKNEFTLLILFIILLYVSFYAS